MASVRYGLIVTDLVGKINGQNFQRGLQSPILRNISTKRTFVKYPQISRYTTNPRAALTMVAQTWQSLSSATRSAWAAVTASFPRLNRYGVTYTPSAYQLFCEFNIYLVVIGSAMITTAPSVSVFAATVWSVSYAGGGGAITITASPVYPSAGYSAAIWAAGYQSNGASLKKTSLKLLTVNAFSVGSPSLNVASLFYSLYGEYKAGTTAWFAIQPFNTASGESQAKQYLAVYF